MRESRVIMGMPVSVEVVDSDGWRESMQKVFDYFEYVDTTFSTYKDDSEISRINRGEIKPRSYSDDMKEVLRLSEETKTLTNGYFDVTMANGFIDPSGLVKGWAIQKAADLLHKKGFNNFYLEAGGDIQTSGTNAQGKEWCLGIRNPFNREQIIKVVYPKGSGIATSGTYIRGAHIYDPHTGEAPVSDSVSLTVIGPNVYEADRFATAAFVMGRDGLSFIQSLEGFEAYAVDQSGTATETSGFSKYSHD